VVMNTEQDQERVSDRTAESRPEDPIVPAPLPVPDSCS